MRVFSFEKIAATLDAVAAETPDRVYCAPDYMRTEDNGQECFYVHVDENGENPEPGCIVGTVLHRLGIPLDDLRQHEGCSASTMVRSLISASDRAVDLLNDAQWKQDSGRSWAESVAMAHENQGKPLFAAS